MKNYNFEGLVEKMRDIFVKKRQKPVFGEPSSILLYHHERYDGKGPYGLKGKQIPAGARIMAVTDAFHAIRSNQPALNRAEAVEELKKKAGTQFDPKVVDAFLRVLKREKEAKVEEQRLEQTKRKKLLCPACSKELRQFNVAGLKASVCLNCEGEWFDSSQIAKIIGVKEPRLTPALADFNAYLHMRKLFYDEQGTLTNPHYCPECGGNMRRYRFVKDTHSSGEWWNSCPQGHGIWIEEGNPVLSF